MQEAAGAGAGDGFGKAAAEQKERHIACGVTFSARAALYQTAAGDAPVGGGGPGRLTHAQPPGVNLRQLADSGGHAPLTWRRRPVVAPAPSAPATVAGNPAGSGRFPVRPAGVGSLFPRLPATVPHRPLRPTQEPSLSSSSDTPIGLTRLNEDPPGVAEAAFLTCCGSRRWARRLAAARPYPDVGALLAAADEAAYDLTPADLAEALAAEASAARPPLGPAPPPAALTALGAAHAAYEARFGHVFVLSLDGAAPHELLDRVLTSIHARLGNDPDDERVVAADELRRLVRSRLAGLAAGGARARR